MDLHHPLTREFPEHLETIKLLKGTNALFRKNFEEYHALDDAIYRVEEEIDFASDQELEELKKKRARLKDQLYYAVTHAAGHPQHRASVRA